MKKAFLVLGIAAFFASCGGDHDDSNLVVGTNAVYPPYESVNQQGEIEGFDIDVARALAKKLEKKLILKEVGFDTLILSLKQGKIDCILSGMSITESRSREIVQIPYQGEPIKSLYLTFWEQVPQSIFPLTQLDSIVVQVATFQDEYLRSQTGVTVKSLEGNSEIIMELRYGKSSAALFEPHIARAMKKKFPKLQLIELPLEKKERVLGNGIGIEKENHLLQQQVKEAIGALKETGVIEALENKWFES